MFKKLIVLLAALAATAAFAATDINKGNQADLEAVKGIGPAMATKIMDERKKAPFRDWADVIDRVKGVGSGNAAKFSDNGLTVNGATFTASAAPQKDKKSAADKPVVKAEKK
jgi:competence protein ComEA